jgi:hypothetical protein
MIRSAQRSAAATMDSVLGPGLEIEAIVGGLQVTRYEDSTAIASTRFRPSSIAVAPDVYWLQKHR